MHGHAYDVTTNDPIPGALVNVENANFGTDLKGYYLGEVSPGTHTIAAGAEGYYSESYDGVEIPEGKLVRTDFGFEPLMPGDVNWDHSTDLADAVLGLRILAGMAGISDVHKEADVSGDDRIGLAEVISIFRKMADLN